MLAFKPLAARPSILLAVTEGIMPPNLKGYYKPVTAKEVDDSEGAYPMDAPLKEVCPNCASPMTVGDYVCWGYCYVCYFKELNELKNT